MDKSLSRCGLVCSGPRLQYVRVRLCGCVCVFFLRPLCIVCSSCRRPSSAADVLRSRDVCWVTHSCCYASLTGVCLCFGPVVLQVLSCFCPLAPIAPSAAPGALSRHGRFCVVILVGWRRTVWGEWPERILSFLGICDCKEPTASRGAPSAATGDCCVQCCVPNALMRCSKEGSKQALRADEASCKRICFREPSKTSAGGAEDYPANKDMLLLCVRPQSWRVCPRFAGYDASAWIILALGRPNDRHGHTRVVFSLVQERLSR